MRTLHVIPLLLTLLITAGCASLGEDPTADWSASQLYEEAKSSLDNADYEQAINYFETLEARYPFGRYAQQAQLEIAYAYYKYGEMDSAIAAADRFIKLNPQHPHVPYAYYLRGLANFDRGAGLLDKIMPRDLAEMDTASLQTAFDDFNTVVERFPDSAYAEDSRQRALYLRNVLAEHEMLVADFYWRRGAYVAVINRCAYVIEHFQGTPSVPGALALMADAYDKLEMTDLAADTRRVLQYNDYGSLPKQPVEPEPAED